MYLVEEFFIITFDGIPLFTYSALEDVKTDLISGFFSAIQKFAKQISDKSEDRFINSLALGNSVFNFLINKTYELYFISKSSKKISSSLINNHLKEIERIFIEEYKLPLKNFEGEVSKFKSFTDTFETYFENNFVKLKGMW
ncbi:MAG: hypothetical protein GF311_19365 [Candidatus Lokiarchaeota archaeon]|nr:hypothetical protein [Candidatus Lokiarchaeota archaeon]